MSQRPRRPRGVPMMPSLTPANFDDLRAWFDDQREMMTSGIKTTREMYRIRKTKQFEVQLLYFRHAVAAIDHLVAQLRLEERRHKRAQDRPVRKPRLATPVGE